MVTLEFGIWLIESSLISLFYQEILKHNKMYRNKISKKSNNNQNNKDLKKYRKINKNKSKNKNKLQTNNIQQLFLQIILYLHHLNLDQ
jgi:hypothetical protein